MNSNDYKLNNIEAKYVACMLLHALGDTVGFKNGLWEFRAETESNYMIALELLFEFIKLGGVNGINLKGWIVSDDTLFHMAVTNALLKYSGKNSKKDDIIIKNNFIDVFNLIQDEIKEKRINRYIGITTKKYISKFSQNNDARSMPYDKDSGGNGCAMRNLAVGLAFFGKENKKTLIDYAIKTSMMTHNSPQGYLAGLSSALFASYAIENIEIEKWPFLLIDVLKSDDVKKYIDSNDFNINNDYVSYINYWNKYVESRFVDGKPLKTRSHYNLIFRVKNYYDNFTKLYNQKSNVSIIGLLGFSALIVAYDALLDCDGKWEKLLIYSVFTSGDSDTIGAIAGGLYGIVYGFGDVPENMLKYLEQKDKLTDLGKNLYKKFYLHEDLKINKKINKK